MDMLQGGEVDVIAAGQQQSVRGRSLPDSPYQGVQDVGSQWCKHIAPIARLKIAFKVIQNEQPGLACAILLAQYLPQPEAQRIIGGLEYLPEGWIIKPFCQPADQSCLIKLAHQYYPLVMWQAA